MNMLIKNRRDKIRMGVLIPCELSNSQLKSQGILFDISQTGIHVRSYVSFATYEKIYISFSVKDKVSFEYIEGKIAWIRADGDHYFIGIRIISITERQKIHKAMRALINS